MFGRYGSTGGGSGSGSGITDAEKKDFNEISSLATTPTSSDFKDGITVIKNNGKLYVLDDAGKVVSIGEEQCIGFFDKYSDLPNDTTGEYKDKLAFVRKQDANNRAGVYIGMGKNLAWKDEYNFLTRDEHVIATVDDDYEHYGNSTGKKRYAISDDGELMEADVSSLDPSANSHFIEFNNDWKHAITNNIGEHFAGLGAIKEGITLSASTDKKINFSSGTIYSYLSSKNKIKTTTMNNQNNALFTVVNQAGIVKSGTNIVNVEDWDDGGRNKTLSSNDCTFSTFYLNYETKKVYQLIGQKVYSSKEEALNNYRFENRLTPIAIKNDCICLGGLITSPNDTTFEDKFIIHSSKIGEIIELGGGGATTPTNSMQIIEVEESTITDIDAEKGNIYLIDTSSMSNDLTVHVDAEPNDGDKLIVKLTNANMRVFIDVLYTMDGLTQYILDAEFQTITLLGVSPKPSGAGAKWIVVSSHTPNLKTTTIMSGTSVLPRYDTRYMIDTSAMSALFNVFLPIPLAGRNVHIKAIDTTHNIKISSPYNIDGGDIYLTTSGDSINLFGDGNKWYVSSSHIQINKKAVTNNNVLYEVNMKGGGTTYTIPKDDNDDSILGFNIYYRSFSAGYAQTFVSKKILDAKTESNFAVTIKNDLDPAYDFERFMGSGKIKKESNGTYTVTNTIMGYLNKENEWSVRNNNTDRYSLVYIEKVRSSDTYVLDKRDASVFAGAVDPFDLKTSKGASTYLFDSFMPRRNGTGSEIAKTRMKTLTGKESFYMGGGINNKSFMGLETLRLSGNTIQLKDKSFAFSFWNKLMHKQGSDSEKDIFVGSYNGGNGEAGKALHIGYRNKSKFLVAFYASDFSPSMPVNLYRTNMFNKWMHVAVSHNATTRETKIILNGVDLGAGIHSKPYEGQFDMIHGSRGVYDGEMAISNLRLFHAPKAQGHLLTNDQMLEFYNKEKQTLIDD